MDVIAPTEFNCAVTFVGVDLPPHMGVSKFGYLVVIITVPSVITVKFTLIDNI